MDLEELARLIDQKWPSTWTNYGNKSLCITCTTRPFYRYYVPGDDDEENAFWILWGLDRLEEIGVMPVLYRACEETTEGHGLMEEKGTIWYGRAWVMHRRCSRTFVEGYCCALFSTGSPSEQIGGEYGKTRAEAVANALYSKLKESVEPEIEDGNSK